MGIAINIWDGARNYKGTQLPREHQENTRKSRIPTSFRLERYAALEHLDSYGWYYQLEKRQDLAMRHRECVENFLGMRTSTSMEELLAEIDDVLRSPLSSSTGVTPYITNEVIREMAPRLTGVHTLTIGELYSLETRVPKKVREDALEEGRRIFGDATASSQPVHNVVKDRTAIGTASVDLNLSDSVLKSDFADWLSFVRLTEPVLARRPSTNATSPAKLKEMRLLPCMDLMLWGHANSVEMTPRELSKAIHNDARYKESSMRLTTMRLAEDLLDDLPRGQIVLATLKADGARQSVESAITSKRLRLKKSRRKSS